MAATLDADQELLHFSFPIEKQEDTDSINPVDGTPDIWITGKATDGTVDADRQIVDPEWSAVALKEWAATGGNVRMAHDPRRPVGKGHDVQVTMDGHYVKSLISDPLAKHFVRTGVLNDYSVGISLPHIKFGPHKSLDPRGEATGGIITGRPDGLSKIAELSVVDRGSNFHSKFQITRKSAGGGDDFGFIGKMVGDEDEITKAAPAGLLTKAIAPAETRPVDISNFQMPDLSITFTPADMAKLVKEKFVQQHYDDLARQAAVEKRDFDRGVGGGVDRDKLPESDFAGPHRSFPIVNQSDVSDALGLAGHADDPAAVRARIHAIARRKGFSVPDDDDSKNKGVEEVTEPVTEKAETPAETEAAIPDVTKEPEDKDAPVKKAKKKKKLPPWLNKPSGDDDGKGSSDDKDDDDSSCKSAHVWEIADPVMGSVECSKCHTTPAAAAGVTASAMDPAPVGELMESQAPMSAKGATPASASGAVAESMQPVPAHREPDGAPMEAMEKDADMSDGDNEKPTKLEAATGMKFAADLAPDPEVAALLRLKACGADEDLGRLHDLTCPAYHPAQVAKYHPYADLRNLIETGAWQRKTLAAAAGPLEAALKMQETWQAALLLKTADPADLNQWRLDLFKAFRDANPGPGTYPTPGSVAPQRYHRPVLTDGRAADAVDYDGPNTSPQVATMAPNAQNFDRPPLSAGEQSPSPSHMKASWEYPSEQGAPVQLTYAQMQKEHQRQALTRMHTHLSRQFPEICPISMEASPAAQPEHHPVPPIAGISKGADPEPAPAAPVAASFKAEPEDGADLFADADVYKGFKKMRKKLGKKVLSGSMTVDEARAKMGRQFAQKGSSEEEVQKAATAAPQAPLAAADLPALVKAAVAEALQPVPLEAVTVESFDPSPAIEAAVTKAVTPLLEKIQAQDTRLAETRRVIDAIADQPDPGTASFAGLAIQPGVQKSRRPAAVPDQAEYAARAQEMVRRNLQSTYSTHSNPYVREAAGEALGKLGVEAAPMT